MSAPAVAMPPWVVRPLRSGEEALLPALQHAAVHHLRGGGYTDAQLEAWAPPLTPERIEAMTRRLAGGGERTWVAEGEGALLGFASFVQSTGALRSLYVHPRWAEHGIGSALLAAVEHDARTLGLDRLWLDASLTAGPFYLRRGYQPGTRIERHLESGERILCIPMDKRLRDSRPDARAAPDPGPRSGASRS